MHSAQRTTITTSGSRRASLRRDGRRGLQPGRFVVVPAIFALAAAGLVSVGANAQDVDPNITNYVPEGDIEQQDGDKEGFDGTLAVGANLSITSNDNVVGQADGFSTLISFSLKGGLDYVSGKHELRNTLQLSQAWSRTPVIDEFLKSNDVLDLEVLYNYFLFSWAGPFARFNLETAILPAQEVSADPVNYVIAGNDGVVRSETTDRLALADPFQPVTLNESVGAFAEPIQTDPFSLSIRLGFGARETFADGVLVVSDDDATPDVVEVIELDDVYQAGAELFVGVGGKFSDNRVTYDAGATALVPFLNNDPEERSATELTRLGLAASVNFSVYEWMGLSYQLKILDDPQLLDEVQIQNNLLLTFNYTFIKRNENLAPKVDPAVEAEKKRATEAEEKAKKLEQEAEELRKALEDANKDKAPEDSPPTGDDGDGSGKMAPEESPEEDGDNP